MRPDIKKEFERLERKLDDGLRSKIDHPFGSMTDPHKCFVCGQPAVGGHGTALGARISYCRAHWPETAMGTAAGCTCVAPIFPHPDCPQHGWKAIYKQQKAIYDKIHKTPDLPLHAKVAKALGKKVVPTYVDNCGWRLQIGDNTWCPIPDFPNDLVAAMGALEEYCVKNSCFPEIGYYAHKRIEERYWSWDVELESHENKSTIRDNKLLPQAICLAIVAHAEGK